MSDDVKAVLAAIKKTAGLRDKIHKELGLGKIASLTIIPEDMYLFEYKKPEFESKNFLVLHGKCIALGQKDLKTYGYEFLQTGHIAKSDKSKAGVKCNHCGEQLDKSEREKYVKERNTRLATELVEYQEEQILRKEWEAEQILLGKM